MPLNVPDGYTVAAFSHTLTGWARPMVCTVGLDTSGAAAVNTTMANAVFTAWANALDTSVTNNLTFTGVVLYWKQPLGYVPVPSTSTAVVGTSSGSGLAPNTAVMIEKNTLRPGRSGKGRFFLPGFS